VRVSEKETPNLSCFGPKFAKRRGPLLFHMISVYQYLVPFRRHSLSRVVRGRTERAKTRRPSVTASAAERLADHERGRD